jgi:hypothetical protein
MVSKASAGRADLVLRGYGRPSVHTCDAERAAGQARGKRLACWQSGPPRDFRATGAGRGETTDRDDEALKIKRSFIQGVPGTDSRAQRRGWQNPSKAEVKHEHLNIRHRRRPSARVSQRARCRDPQMDVPAFIHATLKELQARLAGKDWLAGNRGLREILERLEQVGVRLRIEMTKH